MGGGFRTKFELIAAKLSAMDVYQRNLLYYFRHHSPTTAAKLSYIGHRIVELQPKTLTGLKISLRVFPDTNNLLTELSNRTVKLNFCCD